MTPRRASAALLALAVVVAIVTRIALNIEANGYSVPEAVWRIYRYFTIWTNTAVGVAAALIALRGRLDGRISGGLVLAIVLVAVVYHLLLASENSYVGVEWLIDATFHTFVPIWFSLHWLAFEPKAQVGWRSLPLWLAYPTLYCAYALIRGLFDGKFPYFFLDPGKQGMLGILAWMLALITAFAMAGALIVLLARALKPRQVTQRG